MRGIRAFGEVVKILKATGVAVSFATIKVLWMGRVNGPKVSSSQFKTERPTMKLQPLIGNETDGHLEKLLRREKGILVDGAATKLKTRFYLD